MSLNYSRGDEEKEEFVLFKDEVLFRLLLLLLYELSGGKGKEEKEKKKE